MKADPKLSLIIKRIGPCELHAVAPKDPFETLCMSIASQQLSIKAAATIFRRFCDLFPPDRKPTPERVMTLTDEEIRACGFSRPKVTFIKDLAARVLDGRLDLKGLKKHPDEDVMRQLVAVKGIGRWTAEIFLMFRLGPAGHPAGRRSRIDERRARAYRLAQAARREEATEDRRSVAAVSIGCGLVSLAEPEQIGLGS